MTEPRCGDGRGNRTKGCDERACEPHTCPYMSEVYQGEPESLLRCTCCEACQQECAENV